MLNRQTLQRLRALRLTGMADAFAQQLEQPPTQQLSFEERFALLVDREHTYRDNRRLQRLLRAASFKQQACIEDIDYQTPRGLVRSEVVSLITCDWIRSSHNLHITGPTGTGKTNPHNYPHRETRCHAGKHHGN
jgi:DNA replication protein DnaC